MESLRVRSSSSSRGAKDWRDSLFTVFIDRLSIRVSRSILWELFNHYGKVVDVFLPSKYSHQFKRIRFTFVRYKLEAEMHRAIQMANGTVVDGFCVTVKKASIGWGERSRYGSFRDHIKKKSSSMQLTKQGYEVVIDNHTYKEVLAGSTSQKPQGMKEPVHIIDEGLREVVLMQKHQKLAEERAALEKVGGDVTFNLFIPSNNLEWLHLCAIGTLKEGCDCDTISKGLREVGYKAQVCPMGGLSVLLRFDSVDNLRSFLKNYSSVYDFWFVEVKQWCKSCLIRKILIWIKLEEVPLQLWDVEFFKALGDAWGEFVKVDKETAAKNRFDVAKLLIMVERRLNIPHVVSVKMGDHIFRIIVSCTDESRDDVVAVGMERSSVIPMDASFSQRLKTKGQQLEGKMRGVTTDMSFELLLGRQVDANMENCDFSTRLSERELIGGKEG
ncbi:hypothetical protein PTKIN_Ptkin14bG0052100 [Pterospermum kingtungense]